MRRGCVLLGLDKWIYRPIIREMKENNAGVLKTLIGVGAGFVALDAAVGQNVLQVGRSLSVMADNPMRVFDAMSGSFGESKLSGGDLDLVDLGDSIARGTNSGLGRIDEAINRLSQGGLEYVWQNDSDVVIGALVVFGVIAGGLMDREMRRKGLERVGKRAPSGGDWRGDWE